MIKEDLPNCADYVVPVRDCLDIISGKWKLPILGALIQGKKRFKELERSIINITPRMLSKELRELEINQMVKRTVYDTVPVTVEYELTPYGHSLRNVLNEMRAWGIQHRKRIMGTAIPNEVVPTEDLDLVEEEIKS
ncbi:winged helix-turn-helix transcriptional regulator [Runella zeae]|jgi:DNA-binding HxlR family transcriptional regulator|uniref:winged helix-turn-helix transcriptional regulator n=1 Tax=Runella zeae TaxID=94255 RepID=UPI0003FDD72A|nr:helix-turn-helix domain-containing protein [Runella zeae]